MVPHTVFLKVDSPLTNTTYLVMESSEHGALGDYLRLDVRSDFNASDCVSVIKDVFQGLKFLHVQKNMIHQDIGAHSVFLNGAYQAKIGNLGKVRQGELD